MQPTYTAEELIRLYYHYWEVRDLAGYESLKLIYLAEHEGYDLTEKLYIVAASTEVFSWFLGPKNA